MGDDDYELNRDDESHDSDSVSDDEDNESILSCPDLTKETLGQLKNNDPNLVGLRVTTDNWINGVGLIIGSSRFLNNLKVNLTWDNNPALADLCSGLATIESIEWFYLSIERDPIFDPSSRSLDSRVKKVGKPDDCLILSSFFQNNNNLRGIEITKDPAHMDPIPGLRSLALALLKCTSDKLEKFHIAWNHTADDEEVEALFDTLNKKFSLLELSFSENLLERRGRMALAKLLGKTSSKIHTLALNNIHNHSHDDCMSILCNAILKNNTLQSLDLSDLGDVSVAGWMSLSTVLSHPLSLLESLNLNNTALHDEGIIYLGNALEVNKTLKHLDLSANISIMLAGWREFSTCLPMVLEDLSIEQCDIDDEKAEIISSILVDNTLLKRLNMYNNDLCTIRGLVAFFCSLLRSNSVIEKMAFSDDIDIEDITEEELSILSHALCLTTIDGTYSSNHLFFNCSLFDKSWSDCEEGTVWEAIYLSMKMNRTQKKVEATHAKILWHHFLCGSSGINALASMHKAVLPHALEWIRRDGLGYSAMFGFVQSFSTLFDISHLQCAGSKRRKF